MAAGATPQAMPDIGTKMPDGTVYAGLSMQTGKPSFVPAAGGILSDMGATVIKVEPPSGDPLQKPSGIRP